VTVLLASGTPYLPHVIGGVEINTHEMALELNRRGERTAVLSKLSRRDVFGAIRFFGNCLRRSDVSIDERLGYEVYRCPRPWHGLKGVPLPRLVVVQNGNMVEIARKFADQGVPAIAYLHGLAFESGERRWTGPASKLPFRAYIANSAFTAARFRNRFNVEPLVIPPIFRPERYRAGGEHNYVTFINPVPEKGVELALAIAARCPTIPFRFVKGWPLLARALMSLKARIRRLPNVELVDRKTNMLPIYGATRVLLAPSQFEETWGRVATEAQFSGIPVLASDSGALPEAIGAGGIIVPREAPAELWADELHRLWCDQAHYARVSEAAVVHSRRTTLNLDFQVDQFLSITRRVAA
jgi:glycosyltransferase involved in cell wall biosynthesis